MPSVGQTLRDARLQAGLSLDHISAQTRISAKNLRAIEEDDLGQITSAFFYKSFVRQYCEQAGQPYGRIADQVQEAAKFFPEPFTAGKLEAVLARTLVKPRRRALDFRVPVATASLIAVLVACSSLYSFWREGGTIQSASAKVSAAVRNAASLLPSHAKETVHPGADAAVMNGSRKPEVPPAAVTSEQAQDTSESAPEGGFRVVLSAIEPSWLSIVADGHRTFSGILEPTESKTFEAHDMGRIRTGNAGGVKMVFNGRPVGVVGPRGQIRVIVVTKDNYEVLDPAAPRVAATSLPLVLRTQTVSWTGLRVPVTPDFH